MTKVNTAPSHGAGRKSRPGKKTSKLQLVSGSVERSTASRKARTKPQRSRSEFESDLLEAQDYAAWAEAAKAIDALGEGERWRNQQASPLYDYRNISKRLTKIRSLLRRQDIQGLVFAIEEGLHGNFGSIGNPVLYQQARFGTKRLITDYFDAFAKALLYIEALPASELSRKIRLDLFHRASRCYGRSALMFSGGGSLVYFHFGVARALLDQGLLPHVLSGASAGAVASAVIGTRTDEELAQFLTPENVRFGREWHPSRLERLTGLRRMQGTKDFKRSLSRLVPDLTFREAFDISGRHINISVGSNDRHHGPRVLNAITSPHVMLHSAIQASCALPGVLEPVQLLARDARGKTVPYLNMRWIDGGFAADLPAKQLARLYGVNHYIVSLINPLTLTLFRDPKLEHHRALPLVDAAKASTKHFVRSANGMFSKYWPGYRYSLTNKVLNDVLAQEYKGDISILPGQRLINPLKVVSPRTHEEIAALLEDGERQTWPRIELIRNCTKINRTLDEILKRAGEDGGIGY